MRTLTEQQTKFLQALFGDARGDAVTAKRMAGYSDNTPTRDIVNSLKDEIVEGTKMFIATSAPRAAMAVYGAIDDPTELGIKEKISAAKDLLDRAGVVKTEKIQVEAPNGIMILPAKNEE